MSNLFKLIWGDLKEISSSIKWMALVISFWFFAWGIVDPMWSIYLKSIVNNYALIGVLVALFNLVAMSIVIPLGQFEDHVNPALVVKKALTVYAITGVLYFLAGLYQLTFLLILVLLINGCASPMVLMSARTFIKQNSFPKYASRTMGLFTMSTFVSYALGMFFNSIFGHLYSINSMFLFVSFFSLLAVVFIGNIKIPESSTTPSKPKFRQYLFAKSTYAKVWIDLHDYDFRLYYLLILFFFIGIVEQLVLIFIPLLALNLDLTFAQISALMWFLYLPYVFSFVFAEIADRYERMTVASIGLILASIPMFFIYFSTNQVLVAVLSTLIALSLALINPATEGALISLIPLDKRGEMTGVQSLFRRSGMFIGPLCLGLIAQARGIHFVFLIVATLSIVLWLVSVFIKTHAHLNAEIHLFNRKKVKS